MIKYRAIKVSYNNECRVEEFYAVKIIRQTKTGKDFDNIVGFQCKTVPVILYSMFCPSSPLYRNADNKTAFYMRGTAGMYNNVYIKYSEREYKLFQKAIKEYNETYLKELNNNDKN